MVTHFSTSSQQYNNRTIDNTVDVSIAPCEILFIADVTNVNANASATFLAQFLGANDVVLRGIQTVINRVGQPALGCKLPEGTVRLRLFLDVTGRMTMAFRIVSFQFGEDVPEVI